MKWKIIGVIISIVILLAVLAWIYVGLMQMFGLEYFPVQIIAPIAIIILCTLIIALFYHDLSTDVEGKKEISGLKTTSTFIYICLFIIFISVIVLVTFLSMTYYR
jgi:hypothetical protein